MEDGPGQKKPSTTANADSDDELAEYKLDDYDEEKTGELVLRSEPHQTNEVQKRISSAISMALHTMLITPRTRTSQWAMSVTDVGAYWKDAMADIDLKEDEEEKEELEIRQSDNLIVAAKTEDHVSSLEIYVYDESEDNLYAHHDILLPALPLCLEWLDFPPSSSTANTEAKGNFVAVGTLDPEIEIWSLDVIEGMYPDALLGRPSSSKEAEAPKLSKNKKKKEKKKTPKANPDFHVDAVLGLSWNRAHRNLLASASADKTVKLWDLSRELDSPAIRSFDVHKDKVQAVQWNRLEPTVLLTGGYDRTVRTFDSRSPDSGLGATLTSDVEALKWDPWEGHSFYVS